jgi:hypothetical protein
MREYSGRSNFSGFFEYMTSELNMPEVPVVHAIRGDVVLVENASRCSLGLIAMNGRQIVIAGETLAGAEGLGLLPIDRGVRAWRV